MDYEECVNEVGLTASSNSGFFGVGPFTAASGIEIIVSDYNFARYAAKL